MSLLRNIGKSGYYWFYRFYWLHRFYWFYRFYGHFLKINISSYHVIPGPTYKCLKNGHFPKFNITSPGNPDATHKYLIYGHFPRINISYQGIPGTTYKYLIFGHIPKINFSYQGNLGTTNEYLIYGHNGPKLGSFKSEKKKEMHHTMACSLRSKQKHSMVLFLGEQ